MRLAIIGDVRVPCRGRMRVLSLGDRAALVAVWWLSPGPFRAADPLPLGKSANPPFGLPRSDTDRSHREFFVRP